MSLPVIVLGAGGHAKVLVDALLACSALIAGIVDPDPAQAGSELLGVPVLGDDDLVREFPPEEITLVNGLGSVGLPVARRRVFERFKGLGYGFAAVVHPSAVVAPDVVPGEGAQVMAGAVIQAGCCIGANSIVNTRASVDHDCSLGDHVHLAPGVTLSGGVTIGAGSHLGTGATVIQGIRIGAGCLVGAGSLVLRDVEPGTSVRGVPARVVQP
jgi:sugar O-acyltransferase (sialic acid O-acetyltransferase NeuD family)